MNVGEDVKQLTHVKIAVFISKAYRECRKENLSRFCQLEPDYVYKIKR